MKSYCPNCDKEREVANHRVPEQMKVRGEKIKVEAEFLKCGTCGAEFENTRGHDALDLAYREYRRRHGLLQPEEVQNWRKGYGLTQRELSKLLGWGGATLSRYENGALQSEAHEKMLRLAMEPHNLHRLIQESPDALQEDKRKRLEKELSEVEAEAYSFQRLFEESFGTYDPDELSGYRRLDIGKLFAAILFFCRGGQLKTKLNKLLFYADFKHFKEYAVSLTGARYIHLPYGPVPNNYEFYFAELIREGSLRVEEVVMGQYIGEQFVTIHAPDLNIFTDSEIKVLSEVKDFFKNHTSSQVKDFSHRERGYAETADGDVISYRFAEQLQL